MMKLLLTILFLTLGAGLSQTTTKDESYTHAKKTCLCPQGACDPDWVQYNEACYKKFDASVSWPEAEAICLSHDSHLTSIHNSEEFDFVFNLMGRPNSPFEGKAIWIGMHDSFVEGNFMNTDGCKVTFRRFGDGQPDNLGGEHYVGSWAVNNNGQPTMNDYPLNGYRYPFVCKYYPGNRLCKTDETSYVG